MNVKLFVDGQEVPAETGDIKVVVEDLGANADRQLHTTFGADGVIHDVVEHDGRVSGTYGVTYEELADRLHKEGC